MSRLMPLLLILSISISGGLIPLFQDEARAAATVQRGSSPVERGRQAERVKRFLFWTIDDLNFSRKLTEEDISELEKQYDDITPLESVQREADLLSLLDTRYSYMDWLKDRIEELEEDMGEISADNLPGSEFLENSFLDMVSMLKEQSKILGEKIDRFSAEEKRLAGILERRQLLQSRIGDLEAQLARIENKHSGHDHQGPLETDKKHAERIRHDVKIVQSELLSLPQVDEDILKHYMLMIELGKGESEWIALQTDEFGMLREVAALLPRDTVRFSTEMERAIRRTVRAYESEISVLHRKIDGLDKMRERISPAGTLRETEFSRDLEDLYDRLEMRYNDLINRIKIRIGAWQAEAAEIISVRQ